MDRISFWPSRDPVGEYLELNLYGFGGNDGVNGIDPLGLQQDDLNQSIVDTGQALKEIMDVIPDPLPTMPPAEMPGEMTSERELGQYLAGAGVPAEEVARRRRATMSAHYKLRVDVVLFMSNQKCKVKFTCVKVCESRMCAWYSCEANREDGHDMRDDFTASQVRQQAQAPSLYTDAYDPCDYITWPVKMRKRKCGFGTIMLDVWEPVIKVSPGKEHELKLQVIKDNREDFVAGGQADSTL